MGARMSKNISNEKFDKELKKWLESFSREEWLEKLNEEKYLHGLRKWLELKEDNIGILDFEYVELTREDNRKFSWTTNYEPKFVEYCYEDHEEIETKEVNKAA